jgi:hypothetical protein
MSGMVRIADFKSDITRGPKSADSVAKLFLLHRIQIFRAVRAAIEQSFEGLHYPAMTSRGTSVMAWRLHRSAIAACLVYFREIDPTAFWEFCNTICQQQTIEKSTCIAAAG